MLPLLLSSSVVDDSSHIAPEITFHLTGGVYEALKYMMWVPYDFLTRTYIHIGLHTVSLFDLALGASAAVCIIHMLLPNSFYTGGYDEKH